MDMQSNLAIDVIRKPGAKAGVKQGYKFLWKPTVIVALMRRYENEGVKNMLVVDRIKWMKKNGCKNNTLRNWLANKKK